MHPFGVFHASLRGFSCVPSWFFVRPFVVSRCAQEYGSRVGWGLYEGNNVKSDSIA